MINIHIHTFTIDSVPEQYILPFSLGYVLKHDDLREMIKKHLRNLFPFSDQDILDRYADFLEVSDDKTQKSIFKQVQQEYPVNTKFVVLPMDMEFMNHKYESTTCSYESQLQELAELHQENPDTIIPFVAVDPRRPNVLELVKKYIEEHNFKGIKLYPKLGFYPTDSRLYPIYAYAQEKNIPIMTHCSKGGVHAHKIKKHMQNHPLKGHIKKKGQSTKEFSNIFVDPNNYESILKKFPNLRICLAHFGGNEEWETYMDNKYNDSWVNDIIYLMNQYPNLYTDISYTMFSGSDYLQAISKYIKNNPSDQILFGSDFYMIEREKSDESNTWKILKNHIDNDKFKKITKINCLKYLGENNHT